jgi:hypothetical protein
VRTKPLRRRKADTLVHLIARVVGIGVETADMLVNEVFSRQFRYRKAVARYAGLTGSPDESGKRRRERGLARAGNARVRTGMIRLACCLRFQDGSALAQWFQTRTADERSNTRKTMIVALARKLLNCTLASRYNRRNVGWRCSASFVISATSKGKGSGDRQHDSFGRPVEGGLPMKIRGGGDPLFIMAFKPRSRMDPPPWSSPPMRMTASWCDSRRIDRIQGCGAISA